jgi:hypothetical protein
MNYSRNTLFLISILLVTFGAAFVLIWRNVIESMNYADMKTVLTTTTATFGTLLGIITAGLMFTQGRFSELASELSEKSPDYLTETLSLEKIQSTGTHLLALRKAFTQLEAGTTVAEERNLYRRIVTGTSSMFAGLAVLLNLKLKQQGLSDTGLLVSEMDSQLYKMYKKERKGIRKEWQVLAIIKQVVDVWEAPATFFVEKSKRSTLQADLKNSVSILALKEKIDKSSTNARSEVTKTLSDLSNEISKISRQLHEDRIPQLLSQMEQASAIRGKYFHLALIFIASPLFINLLIMPQLSEPAAAFFKLIIAVTSLLSVMGVIFLLLYIHKILNV